MSNRTVEVTGVLPEFEPSLKRNMVRFHITEEEARKAVKFFDVKTPNPGDHFRFPGSDCIYVRVTKSTESALKSQWQYGPGHFMAMNIRTGGSQVFALTSKLVLLTLCIKEIDANHPD